MAWTADKVRQMRQSSPGQSAKQDEKEGKWTAERVRQVRTTTPVSSTPKAAKGQTAKTASADRQLEKAYEDYRAGNNLGFAAEQQGVQTAKPVTGIGAGVTLGDKYANAAQRLKNSYAADSQPDAFDRANQWIEQPGNRKLVEKMQEQALADPSADVLVDWNGTGVGAAPGQVQTVGKRYSTADLKKMGYTDTQIREAESYLETMKNLPVWQRGVRRTANAVGGAADVIASIPFLTGENLVQAVKNETDTSKNWNELKKSAQGDTRQRELLRLMTGGKTQYAGRNTAMQIGSDGKVEVPDASGEAYTDAELRAKGYGQSEIDRMRQQIGSTRVDAGVAPEKSVGYQLYDRGRQLTGAAQSGLTEAQKQAMGIVTSAGENLGITALNPRAVLPVLSGQGAADAMAQAMEQGQSAGKTLASGAMKFGAGWAINSVAVADLAKTMGAGAAKDSVAGQIAEWVRKVSSSEALREEYPAIANAISGGIDNAMQAFVETYADQAIDAALGDSEAAQSLLTRDTFLQALESGLTGGASGALGGAVGTGLAKINAGDASLLGNAEYYAAQADYEKAQKAVQELQRRQALAQEPGQAAQDAAGNKTSQSPDGDSSPTEGSPWQDGQAVLDEQSTAAREVQGTAEAETETGLRETYGMQEEAGRSEQQRGTERTLKSWGVSEQAAKEIGQKLPEGTDADRYAAAASTLYRLGQLEDVKSFDQALELAGSGSGMAANVNYVLGSVTGRNALEIAYTYGKDAAGTRWESSRLGGNLTEQSRTGKGETLYAGTMRSDSEAASRVIELNAAATGTTAVLKNVLRNESGRPDSRVRAYVDTETGRIFFGDSANDVFGTALHEDWHWYNALDAEGGQQLMDHALEYLARANGFETVDEMIRGRMADYAGQGLTYEEAAEEMVGDAWRGIFSTEEDFRRWVQFQKGQAEKNAGKSGTIRKVMDRVKEMLGGIVNRAKEILSADPENEAARRAQRLAEKERRILQDEYFAHAEKAMDNLRAAKENGGTVKKNIQFQLGSPVEVDTQKDLVAVHNLTEENLKEALELGGMPSPSIAVVKANEGHTKYGPISLVFGPESIDPMVNRSNRIYGSDAWTPTRPSVEYKVDADKARKLNGELAQLARRTAEGTFARNNLLTEKMDMEASDKSPKQLAEQLAKDDSVKAAYLTEKGETVQKVMKKESRYTESQVNRYEKIMNDLGGKEQLIRIVETDKKNGNHDEANAVLEKVRQSEKEWDMEQLGWDEEKATKKADKLILPMLRARLTNAYEYAVFGNTTHELIQDIDAMRQELQQKAPDSEVEQWLLPKMEQVLGEKGIYNGKEVYTKTDNQRSFAQLHNAYTLENLVQAMNSQQAARGQGVFGASASALMSTATAEYRNLDEVRADKGRLQQIPEEEYKALLEKADAQMDEVIDRLRRETTAHADNSFEEREILGTVLMQAAQEKRTAAAIGKAFAKEGYTIGKDTAQMILKLYKDVAAIPTGYFEAKPQRAVGFDEVRAAILPDNASRSLIESLKEKGVDVELYKAGDDANRTEVLNRVPDVRFQKAEQADRESRKNIQRQASRAIADNSVMLETLGEMMGITHGVRISQDSIEGLALRWTKTNGSKADRTKLAGETRALVEYLESEGADMTKAQSLAETLAGEVLDGATYRNTELWDQYPEFHELSYTVNRDGQAKAELVKRYGSWSEAVAEARRHGVKLRQAEGVRDGNPAEQYESIVNDTRAVGGVKDGAAALFRQAAKQAGVDGAASMESTEWLDILMNVRDTIKPKVMSRFEDVAEYEDAKVELAGRMIGDILNTPEMNDAQAIFESFQKWQRYAVAAAVGEENADAALKELRKVQKDQNRDFNRRLYENRRKGSRNEALQKLTEMQVSNAKAEELLDKNLETLGVDITNSGDLAEKLDLLKEAYERGWKEEKKRLREERQDMIDSIRLENQKLKRENYALSYEVAGEQKRADAAEWQLIHQQNEMMEWEDENQRKAQAWQEEQARRNAIAVDVARQQRDEDISIARKIADKRVAKAREMRDRDVAAAKESRDRDVAKAREMRDRDIAWAEQVAARRVEIARAGRRKDEYRRIIRNNRTQLNQMILHPSKDKYVQPNLIKQAAAVAQIADMALVNDSTMARLTRLRDSIAAEVGKEASPSGMSTDWENSGIGTMIDALTKSMTDTKEAKLDRLRGQLAEAEALPDSDKARDLRASLERRIMETDKQPYQPMTADQLQLLKAITTSTLHVIRTANKTLSQEKAEAVDRIAQDAAEEVIRSKGNGGTLRNALTKYNLDMLGGTRVFRMLGGYTKNGQMEKLGTMLNDGQRRQTEILVEGTHRFDNVTGKDNLKQMEAFAGPGAELVDLGLKDAHGKAVPLTHAQMCSLYMHLQNTDSREHLQNGGFTVPDAEAYNRGEIEEAYQKGQTVNLGILTDSEGKPVADTIVNAIEKNLTDYDRLWIADMKDFFGSYTTDLINETSMKLLGFRRATVKNYYPIAVDRTALASQIEGVKLDATIEGRGFLKERVKSQKPILLEECSSVVQRSLRDTAAYAGLAPAIRDVQKVLNCGIETVDGIKVLKNGILKEKWGSSAVNYVDDLLTDLQTKQRKRDNGITRAMKKLRGNYAGAILTLNPGVAIAQAASLPTAGAVLGADTMAAVVPFVKNLSGKQRAALEAEIAEHGDALLEYRLRGSRQGELASVGVDRGLVQNAMDKLPKGLTGWIGTMDEITVASLWEGAKRYVEHHAEEFNLSVASGDSSPNRGALGMSEQSALDEQSPMGREVQGSAVKGSIIKDEAYWAAVNRMYQKVIEETQPNYTTMQRAGIQRNPDEMVKSMVMFTTQRFQNYGILADAVMDYNAQRTRYGKSQSAEAKAELDRAGQNLSRAVTSQVVQTAVFALMKIGADFLLHRWDREQDENGDVTALSVAKRFAGLYTESAAGNFLYGSELYALVNNAIQGKDYDVVSATNISAVNDLMTSALKLERLLTKDTSEMDEEELKAHHAKVQAAWVSVAEYGLSIKGVPAANVRKIVEAFKGYAGDVEKAAKGEGFSFSSLPASATGQYDRLYNAIQSGDSEEAKAALGKLEGMGKDEKTILSQMNTRLKKYSPEVEQAAQARNEGRDRERQAITKQLTGELYEVLGIREGVKADAEKRSAVIGLVTGAIDQKADSLLDGDKDRTVYSDLQDALDGGRRKDVQEEIDRLRTAGKEDDVIRSKITAAVKEEYLAGNDRDRAKLEELLLSLTKADGTAMYEEKTFAQWVSNAEKEAEKAKNTTDEWAGVR